MEQVTINTATASPIAPEFTAATGELLTACKFLAGKIVERRPRMAVLKYVLVECLPDMVRLTATDLDLQASIDIPARCDGLGAFAVDVAALAKTLSKLPKVNKTRLGDYPNETHIKCAEGYAIVRNGRQTNRMPTYPAADFPVLAYVSGNVRFDMPAGFTNDLARLIPFVSTDQSRYYISGIAIQLRELAGHERLCMVATSGAEMSVCSYPLPKSAAHLPDMILPTRAAVALQELIKGGAVATSWGVNDKATAVAVQAGNFRLVSKLIDGDFPNWQLAIEKAPIDLGAEPLLIPELAGTINPATVAKLEKLADSPLSWELMSNGGCFVSEAARPDWLFIAYPQDGQKGYEVRFDQGRENASRYLSWLASERNLPALGEPHLIEENGEILGATFGECKWSKPETVEIKNWETLSIETKTLPAVQIWQNGAYSVAMPRERAKLASNVTLDIEGRTYDIATDTGGRIALSREAIGKIDAFTGDVVQLYDTTGAAHYVLASQWQDESYSDVWTCNESGQFCAPGTHKVIAGLGRCLSKADLSETAPEITLPEPQIEAVQAQEPIEAGEVSPCAVIAPCEPVAAQEPIQCAPVDMPEPESESIPEPQPASDDDRIAELQRRIDKLQGIVDDLMVIALTPPPSETDSPLSEAITPPSEAIGQDKLPADDRAMVAARIGKAKPSNDRARRERTVRAYLRMRKERAEMRKHILDVQRKLASQIEESEYQDRKKCEYRDAATKLASDADDQRAKRARALSKARQWRGAAWELGKALASETKARAASPPPMMKSTPPVTVEKMAHMERLCRESAERLEQMALRAVRAENALRALEGRQQRGYAPYQMNVAAVSYAA